MISALVTSFLSAKVFYCNDQLIPQLYETVEMCFSHCEILDQVKNFVVVSLEHVKFNIQVLDWILDQTIDQTCLDSFQIHIIGTG